jgi:hypothetical protein
MRVRSRYGMVGYVLVGAWLSSTSIACRSAGRTEGRTIAVQGDESRPAIPATLDLPGDSTLTVEDPPYSRAELLYYRNVVGIVFDDSTTGVTVRTVFARYDATVIGGVPGRREYVVRLPDPGPTLAALNSLLARLNHEPGLEQASPVYYRTPGTLYRRDDDNGR